MSPPPDTHGGFLAFYIRGPVSKTQPLICVLCETQASRQAWGTTRPHKKSAVPPAVLAGAPDAATLADACVLAFRVASQRTRNGRPLPSWNRWPIRRCSSRPHAEHFPSLPSYITFESLSQVSCGPNSFTPMLFNTLQSLSTCLRLFICREQCRAMYHEDTSLQVTPSTSFGGTEGW